MSEPPRAVVEFYYDQEVGTWFFRMEEPHMIGGGQATLVEAVRAAADALAFALGEEEVGPRQSQHGDE